MAKKHQFEMEKQATDFVISGFENYVICMYNIAGGVLLAKLPAKEWW